MRNDFKMKNTHSYWVEIDHYRISLAQNGLLWNEHTINTFTFFKANMQHFMPMIDHDDHIRLFKQFNLHNWLNTIDTALFKDKFPWRIEGKNQFLNQISLQPGLICTFHFGAYQLINYLLVTAKVPFALLVAEKVVHDWQVRHPQLNIALQKAREKGRFVLLNANERTALKHMHLLVKKGFHIVVYLDGLQGTQIANNNAKEKIPFLGQQILVPRGIATFAAALRLPVYPMVALRRKRTVILHTLPVIMPLATMDKKTYVTALITRIYAWFATFVIHWPEQWTNWPHLSAFRSDQKALVGQWYNHMYTLEKEKYGIYKSADNYFLLRNSDMTSFLIDSNEFETLRQRWYNT